MANIAPKPNSIPTIVCGYKSAVTKQVHLLGLDIQWQPRFHDRIIRDIEGYQTISNYIENNPRKWKEDTFF